MLERIFVGLGVATLCVVGCPADLDDAVSGQDTTAAETTMTTMTTTTTTPGTDDTTVAGDDDTMCDAVFCADADGDGFGDPNDAVSACGAPAGYVSDCEDCDDSNPDVFPDAPETCNDVDDDCDGDVDEAACVECSQLRMQTTGNLYSICDTPLSWADAEAYCVSAGGNLLHLEGPSEAIFIASQMIALPAWIGLTDQRAEGTYVWSNGTALDYENWGDNQPDDRSGDDDCIAMNLMRQWDDQACTLALPFVCELAP